MKLYITELEKVLERGINDDLNKVIHILLMAVNDWPNPILSLDQYEIEIEGFIKNKTLRDNIEAALRDIDYSNSAWESESLYQLIGIFRFYEHGISLKEIIGNLNILIKNRR